ncbi:uncharacterized protein LOC113233005 isoform X2 [Hyposmocoma kahamanoa]|uniref:uncharacterized protein LOC113233005 isoform X2 n=1 Tax=Hyposmocoma kahamanoa TaxID=1477025 RepID=UPI000E6D66EF|nr:uncharacterized protein LOC113233005 isoform X2 [Hyposmocoma kahamanoa]
MGRYGLPHTMAEASLRAGGRDVVDNVMSKLPSSSPKPIRHSKEVRRKSIDQINPSTENYTDDEGSDNWQEMIASLNTHNVSRLSGSTHNTSHSFNNSSIQESNNSNNFNYVDDVYGKSSDMNIPGSTKQSALPKLTLALLLGVVAIAAGWQFGPTQGSLNTSNNYEKAMFYKDLNELGEKYGINDDSILQIKSGIATISEKQDTASFVFLYKSDTRDFDENNFNNFVNAAASFAAKYLRTYSASIHHITVDGSELRMPTYSDLIREYRDDITRTGVMLLKDLVEVPSKLAMAFHYYCDELNPLAKKSAIFFTLDMAKCSNSPSKQSTHERIESCLASKWTDVPGDNLKPLLTRIVNIVVDVTGTK